MACATPMLTILRNPITMPRAELTMPTQRTSTIQAANRVTGPASSWEKTMPSGVAISKVFVFEWSRRARKLSSLRLTSMRSGSAQEKDEQNEFHYAKTNFHPIRNDRLVVLREKRFDEASPYQHQNDSEDECDHIAGNGSQPGGDAEPPAPADQRSRQHQASLAAHQDGRDLDDAVGEKPADQECALARQHIIDRHQAQNNSVVE